MKLKCQRLLIFSALIIMILSGITTIASAEIDGQGDIWHHKASTDGITWTYEQSTDVKNDIDIKEISYSVEGTTLTVTMEVYGTIQSSANIAYLYFFNTTDVTYFFTWTTTGYAFGYSWDYFNDPESIDPLDYLEHISTGNITAEGSVLTGTIELLGSSEPTIVWGYATEYLVDFTTITDIGQIEWWGDFVPNTFFTTITGYDPTEEPEEEDPEETDGEDTTDGGGTGTPGFEIFGLIIGISVLIYMYKRKR